MRLSVEGTSGGPHGVATRFTGIRHHVAAVMATLILLATIRQRPGNDWRRTDNVGAIVTLITSPWSFWPFRAFPAQAHICG
jgi:hypothetical protein